MSKTRTKGDVIVEELKVGDTIYEFEYGVGIKSIVKTLPKKNKEGNWEWTTELRDRTEITYMVNPDYPHYAPNIYTSKVYGTNKLIE